MLLFAAIAAHCCRQDPGLPMVDCFAHAPAKLHCGVLIACRLEALKFDEDAVRQLEATVAQERAAVQRCQERVDELNSQLAGRQSLHTRSAQTDFAGAASYWATWNL